MNLGCSNGFLFMWSVVSKFQKNKSLQFFGGSKIFNRQSEIFNPSGLYRYRSAHRYIAEKIFHLRIFY